MENMIGLTRLHISICRRWCLTDDFAWACFVSMHPIIQRIVNVSYILCLLLQALWKLLKLELWEIQKMALLCYHALSDIRNQYGTGRDSKKHLWTKDDEGSVGICCVDSRPQSMLHCASCAHRPGWKTPRVSRFNQAQLGRSHHKMTIWVSPNFRSNTLKYIKIQCSCLPPWVLLDVATWPHWPHDGAARGRLIKVDYTTIYLHVPAGCSMGLPPTASASSSRLHEASEEAFRHFVNGRSIAFSLWIVRRFQAMGTPQWHMKRKLVSTSDVRSEAKLYDDALNRSK